MAPVSSPPPEARLETVLSCTDLDAMTRFFEGVGLRIDAVRPADDPVEIAMSGAGAHIRLRRADVDVAGCLVLRSGASTDGSTSIVAPNGTVVELDSASTDVVVPDATPSFSLVRFDHDGESGGFGVGRAGMRYRDLLPDRWGGRFVASHIVIDDGGDVADYVHFHRIRFQMIFVVAGWVDVVYEDQGPPFRMVVGDCVLQPPGIRHRVLRSSPGLEVVEIGCPAIHDTVADHDLVLPTPTVDPDRLFGGQRFVRHVAHDAPTTDSIVPGLSERDTGIAAATDGLAGARVLDVTGPGGAEPRMLVHDGEFAMSVVLAGCAELAIDGDDGLRSEQLGPRDAVAIPAGLRWGWSNWSDDFAYLDVTLPARTVRLA